jgi:hypothetical protein
MNTIIIKMFMGVEINAAAQHGNYRLYLLSWLIVFHLSNVFYLTLGLL